MYRIALRNFIDLINTHTDTASDFTVKVRNYPDPGEGIDIDNHIQSFFEKHHGLVDDKGNKK
jgi:hypothetical protein